jgi:hypothetical protein
VTYIVETSIDGMPTLVEFSNREEAHLFCFYLVSQDFPAKYWGWSYDPVATESEKKRIQFLMDDFSKQSRFVS